VYSLVDTLRRGAEQDSLERTARAIPVARFRLRASGIRIRAAIRIRATHLPEDQSMRLLLHWVLSAIALILVSHLVPGFHVAGFIPALIAALVIGLLNATVGLFLKIITFPLSILTLGLFLLVINGVMILVASSLVPGFRVYGLGPAFWGAVVLALLGMLIRAVTKDA
jgi:putative membrane protein